MALWVRLGQHPSGHYICCNAAAEAYRCPCRRELPHPPQGILAPSTPHLDEVGDVGGQLLHHGVVEALDVLQHALVVLADEVDGHALAAKAAGAADTVQVVLGLGGQVIVDDQGDLREGGREGNERSVGGWEELLGRYREVRGGRGEKEHPCGGLPALSPSALLKHVGPPLAATPSISQPPHRSPPFSPPPCLPSRFTATPLPPRAPPHTCWTSIPRASRSVVMSTREEPERNSRMMTSRVFWSMSPWVADTVWSLSRILSVSQSTCGGMGRGKGM